MTSRPRLHPQYRAVIVEGRGALLLSDLGDRALKGRLFEQLIPLIDGASSPVDLAMRLEAEHPPAEVFYTLSLLEAQGYLTSEAAASPASPPMPLGAAPRQAPEPVALRTIGALPAAECSARLERRGIRCLETAPLTLLLTDSYLRPEIVDVDAEVRAAGGLWLPARVTHESVWIGPVFGGENGACWHCLHHRLARNRPFEYHLIRQFEGVHSLGSTVPEGDALDAMIAVIAGVWAEANGRATDSEFADAILAIEGGFRRRHPVSRRPQCPACGDATAYTDAAAAPIVLRSRPKGSASIDDYAEQVRRAGRSTHGRGARCRAGAGGFTRRTPCLDCTVRWQSRKRDRDRCWTVACARAPARVPPTRRRKSAAWARPSSATPRCIRATSLDASRRSRSWVPTRFIPTPACSSARPNTPPLLGICRRRVDIGCRRHSIHENGSSGRRYGPSPPSAGAFCPPRCSTTPTQFRRNARTVVADPSGNAAGNSLEEAVLHGLLELIERDALAIWWYNRIRRPAIALDAFDDPYIHRLAARYAARGRALWALDLTTDLGIPAVAAVSRRVDGGPDAVLLGFGAHLDLRNRAHSRAGRAHSDRRAGRPRRG